VNGNSPDPATVGGLVKYELTTFDYYLGNTNTKFNPAEYSNNIRGRNLDEVRGVALFKVLPENKLQAEFFPDTMAAEAQGFTPNVMVYER
jgi:hypothetical protein